MKRLTLATLLLGFTCGAASGDVFLKSPTATSGVISEGQGQALYGGFGRNVETAGPAYNVYRKYGQRDPSIPLQELKPVAGNPSAANWEGLHHNGTTGIIDPGMFIGTSPSTRSYEDQLLYLRPVIDNEGPGNGDTNFRQNWDLRFGFLESPQKFIAGRPPNSEDWDLWSGEWKTDGISLQLNIGTSDNAEEDTWYQTSGLNFKMNAEENFFANEGARDNHPTTRQYLGSGEAIETAGGTRNFMSAGYDDPLEISWAMAENDPGNADPMKAREVRLDVKVGSILISGVFDPGDAANPATPNFGWEEFSDGFFDWKNATPVFFMAPVGGSQNAEGIMGIFEPGDFNADGVKNDQDKAILQANLGGIDTTYALGDLDQDGDTDADDLSLWESGGGLLGDYNNNQTLDAGDIDILAKAIRDGDMATKFDLNGDQVVNLADHTFWAKDQSVAYSWIGDANLDGEFGSADFVQAFLGGAYENGQSAGWGIGDWNGDGLFTTADFVASFLDGGYEAGARPAVNAVPEPSSIVLMLVCTVAVARTRRRRLSAGTR